MKPAESPECFFLHCGRRKTLQAAPGFHWFNNRRWRLEIGNPGSWIQSSRIFWQWKTKQECHNHVKLLGPTSCEIGMNTDIQASTWFNHNDCSSHTDTDNLSAGEIKLPPFLCQRSPSQRLSLHLLFLCPQTRNDMDLQWAIVGHITCRFCKWMFDDVYLAQSSHS